MQTPGTIRPYINGKFDQNREEEEEEQKQEQE